VSASSSSSFLTVFAGEEQGLSTAPGAARPDAGAPPQPVAESTAERAARLLHGCFEAAPDAVLLVDPLGRIVQLNRAAEMLFGFERAELLGQPLERLIPERLRAAHRTHHAAYLKAPRSRRMGAGTALLALHRAGHEFAIDVALSSLDDVSGPLLMAAVRDVTEQRRLEAELLRRTRDLEEADRQKDRFVATLAHELRSPLATLANIASVLRLRADEDGSRAWAAGVVERQTAHMSQLVEDLLDVARVRSGRVVLRRQPIDLIEVVARACELGRPLIEARRHRFEVTVPPAPVRVDGDATRLAQVLANLLTNAARYTPEGGSIHLLLTAETAHAVLSVRDTGIGLPADMLTRAFELFAQAPGGAGASAGGLGIGLALVRSLVEMHGGTVTAHSEGAGKGSEFVVRLPLLREAIAAGAA
jgi:PAS domain S-box-containing protein